MPEKTLYIIKHTSGPLAGSVMRCAKTRTARKRMVAVKLHVKPDSLHGTGSVEVTTPQQ